MDTTIHLARLTLTLALLIAFRGHLLAQIILSVGLYLASFSFTHDVSHGALGLPRKTNEWMLALVSLGHLISGHSMRLMHQRHHARPLAADDLEGGGAAVGFWTAIAIGPKNAVLVRTRAWAAANATQRRWIAFEYALLALAAGAALAGGLHAFVLVCLAMHLTASFWASHVPHHPPAIIRALAPAMVATRSIALIGFILHDVHHAHPKLPARLLPRVHAAVT